MAGACGTPCGVCVVASTESVVVVDVVTAAVRLRVLLPKAKPMTVQPSTMAVKNKVNIYGGSLFAFKLWDSDWELAS